jgi:hypothetical protein
LINLTVSHAEAVSVLPETHLISGLSAVFLSFGYKKTPDCLGVASPWFLSFVFVLVLTLQ